MDAKTIKQMLVIIAVSLQVVAIGAWCIAMIEDDTLIFALFGFIFVMAQSFVPVVIFEIVNSD